jgi:hypothetical protein
VAFEVILILSEKDSCTRKGFVVMQPNYTFFKRKRIHENYDKITGQLPLKLSKKLLEIVK